MHVHLCFIPIKLVKYLSNGVRYYMGCLNGMSSGARVDPLRPLAALITLFQYLN